MLFMFIINCMIELLILLAIAFLVASLFNVGFLAALAIVVLILFITRR